MIKVRRTPKPAILQKKSHAWTWALLAAGTARERRKLMNRYRHEEIRGALVAMFHGKCAYCESKITHISFSHIEHYRPKQDYPERTFLWGNLLLACERCNNAKDNDFPDAAHGGPLVNSVKDNPNRHFHFFYDPVARLTTVIPITVRGETTEQLLKLNRPDLRGYRSSMMRRLYALKIFAEQGDPEAIALWQEAQTDSAEYAAFVRSFPPLDYPPHHSGPAEPTIRETP